MKTLAECFEEKYITEPNSGCWLWLGAISSGYGSINLKGKTFRAHRASWAIHRGPIPEGLYVLHKCDTPCCVNPNHLFLGNQSDNINDAVAKGRYCYLRPQGEKSSGAKLNQEQVETIRVLSQMRVPQISIAERYNVNPRTIREIQKGRSWRKDDERA